MRCLACNGALSTFGNGSRGCCLNRACCHYGMLVTKSESGRNQAVTLDTRQVAYTNGRPSD